MPKQSEYLNNLVGSSNPNKKKAYHNPNQYFTHTMQACNNKSPIEFPTLRMKGCKIFKECILG